MYRRISCAKDAYITNKVIGGKSKVSASVGLAGSLDLFKLHDLASGSGVTDELTRLFLHFDLTTIRDLSSSGLLDTNSKSFFCKLSLKDVYGGQPVPTNFTVSVFPLSASFEEGIGKDIVYYTDVDATNWLSSSRGVLWNLEGCSSGGGATQNCDYITSSMSIASTEAKQKFTEGTEDLLVDVTSIVSATLTGELPDSGFRITYTGSIETDSNTYFVKRFASRHAYDEIKRPELIFGFDDSISDDTQNLTFDTDCNINLYNYVKGNLQNLISASSILTGSNCLKLKLVTETGGYSLTFSGSQFSLGSNSTTGTYFSTVHVSSSNTTISTRIEESGSVKFTPVWMANDSLTVFVSGSKIEMKKPTRTAAANKKKFYKVSVTGIDDSYSADQDIAARVNIFDYNDPAIKFVKKPAELAGIVLTNVFYSVREVETNRVVMPFDEDKKSTKVSSDSEGMFFVIKADSLTVGRTYAIDILTNVNGVKNIYQNASQIFRINQAGQT